MISKRMDREAGEASSVGFSRMIVLAQSWKRDWEEVIVDRVSLVSTYRAEDCKTQRRVFRSFT